MSPESHGSTAVHIPRVGVMLAPTDSQWLNAFASEILAASGANISRAEIVHAAIVGLQELHRNRTGLFDALASLTDVGQLESTVVAAVRRELNAVANVPIAHQLEVSRTGNG